MLVASIFRVTKEEVTVLNMAAASTSETSVNTYQSTRCRIPEDLKINTAVKTSSNAAEISNTRTSGLILVNGNHRQWFRESYDDDDDNYNKNAVLEQSAEIQG